MFELTAKCKKQQKQQPKTKLDFYLFYILQSTHLIVYMYNNSDTKQRNNLTF